MDPPTDRRIQTCILLSFYLLIQDSDVFFLAKLVCVILPLPHQVTQLPYEGDLPHLGAGFAHLAVSAAFCRVVGTVDGCLICVKPPTEDAICFLNGKLLHFVQSQAVCGHTAKLSDVFTGFLENSPIIFLRKCCPTGSRIIMHPLKKLQQDSEGILRVGGGLSD